MNQNSLYLLVGVMIVLVLGMGLYIWQEERKPDGVEIRVNENGISVEGN